VEWIRVTYFSDLLVPTKQKMEHTKLLRSRTPALLETPFAKRVSYDLFMYICMHMLYMYPKLYTCIHTRVHIYIHTYILTHTRIHTYIHASVPARLGVCVCANVCVCVCVCL